MLINGMTVGVTRPVDNWDILNTVPRPPNMISRGRTTSSGTGTSPSQSQGIWSRKLELRRADVGLKKQCSWNANNLVNRYYVSSEQS